MNKDIIVQNSIIVKKYL